MMVIIELKEGGGAGVSAGGSVFAIEQPTWPMAWRDNVLVMGKVKNRLLQRTCNVVAATGVTGRRVR